MFEIDYTALTDEELKEVLEEAWSSYMYYEATENQTTWEREREARDKAHKKYIEIASEAQKRGLSI